MDRYLKKSARNAYFKTIVTWESWLLNEFTLESLAVEIIGSETMVPVIAIVG